VNRERALKIVLGLVGLLFLAGVYPVTDSYGTRISRCIPRL